jgi:hypothetical protein
MMNKLIPFMLLIVFNLTNLQAQKNQMNKTLVGKWKFETPYVAEGYQKGVIDISSVENNYNVAITFADTLNKIPGYNAKFENEVFDFVVYIEGQGINIFLKLTDAETLIGKAATPDGELPLTLIRIKN